MAAVKVATISIKGGTVELVAAEQMLAHIPGATEKAIKRATTRTASFANTRIARAITRGSNIKAAITREKLKKGKIGDSGAYVRLNKTGRLGIRHFKGVQTETGVMFRVGKKDKWLFVPRAFTGPTREVTKIGEMVKQGRKKVYQRLAEPRKSYTTQQNPKWKGNAAVRIGRKRLPIVFVKGVSPAGYFVKNKLELPGKMEISDFFRKRLRHEILFILKPKIPKRK